jgi:putative methyltransferase (TIGR04325 family)
LPPALIRGVRNSIVKSNRFIGPFENWDIAKNQCTGYESPLILEKVLKAAIQVKKGEALYERDSATFDEINYSWPLVSGLMMAAAKHHGVLNVLDFGGSLGSSYFQHKSLFKSLSSFKWNVVEQSHFVEVGIKHFQDNNLMFYKSIENCLNENKPNVVLISAVLQYLPAYKDSLNALKEVNADIIILDRTIVNETNHDKLHIQIVPENIYKATYPCWTISESNLLKIMENKYKLLSTLPSLNFEGLEKINSKFKGYLFEKNN